MSDTLIASLERERSGILARILGLGDFRSGSITAFTARCGKPSCRCHQPGEAGHGPNYRLTRKIDGKSVTETFPSPAALRKARAEVDEFHRFRRLSAELLEVNEKLCKARPAEADSTVLEKKRRTRSAQPSNARSTASSAS